MNNTKTGISPETREESPSGGLRSGFTPLGMWAFSIGTSIGWGSFIVTCNTYLQKSGVLGTVFGLLIGMAVIFVISWNLQYMIRARLRTRVAFTPFKSVWEERTWAFSRFGLCC